MPLDLVVHLTPPQSTRRTPCARIQRCLYTDRGPCCSLDVPEALPAPLGAQDAPPPPERPRYSPIGQGCRTSCYTRTSSLPWISLCIVRHEREEGGELKGCPSGRSCLREEDGRGRGCHMVHALRRYIALDPAAALGTVVVSAGSGDRGRLLACTMRIETETTVFETGAR